ncbi:MAG: DNA polymerase III subunit chi, partial [Aquisalimonadaceae bacterium]
MERVDFYIVESEAPADCDAVVCRLAEKAWDSGLRLHIRTTDAAQAARMDKMLWIYRQDSFLPHGLLDDNSDDPIVLGAADQYAPTGYDMLINLAPDVSARLDAYQRVAEVACREPVQLKAARSRFKWYR